MTVEQSLQVPELMGLAEWKQVSLEGFGSSQIRGTAIKISLHMAAVSHLQDMETKIYPVSQSPNIRSLAPGIARELCDAGLKLLAGRLMLAEEFEVPGSRFEQYSRTANAVIGAYKAQYAPAAEAIARGESPRVAMPEPSDPDMREGLEPLVKFLNSF